MEVVVAFGVATVSFVVLVVFVIVLGLATATVLFDGCFGVVCAFDTVAISMTATNGRMIFFITNFCFFEIVYAKLDKDFNRGKKRNAINEGLTTVKKISMEGPCKQYK